MKSQKGITLVTMIVMVVIMTIIASVSITGGISILRESKEQVNADNLAAVKIAVGRESAKATTSGTLTPANATFYGIENATLTGVSYDENGQASQLIKNIGEDWYLLNESALKDMGIEYANEEYVVNYKLNIVIPMSTTENIHDEISLYNAQ